MPRALLWPVFLSVCISFSLAKAESITCSTPNDYDFPTHLVPTFKIEKHSDHVVVKNVESGFEEVLYPYYYDFDFVNHETPNGYSAFEDSYWPSSESEEGHQWLSARIGFGTKPFEFLPLSEVYNGPLPLWATMDELIRFDFDPQGKEYIGFAYYYPYQASDDGGVRRVVGDTYYCPLRELDEWLYKFEEAGSLTKFSRIDLEPLTLELELRKSFDTVLCDPWLNEDNSTYWYPNRCAELKKNLFFVLGFDQRKSHPVFDFEELQKTTFWITEDESKWITSEQGRAVLQINVESTMWELNQILPELIRQRQDSQ